MSAAFNFAGFSRMAGSSSPSSSRISVHCLPPVSSTLLTAVLGLMVGWYMGEKGRERKASRREDFPEPGPPRMYARRTLRSVLATRLPRRVRLRGLVRCRADVVLWSAGS